jgi:malate synthase
MEDAATAEISRAQVWQWVRYGSQLKDGRAVTDAMVREMIHRRADELAAGLAGDRQNDKKLRQAAKVLEDLTTNREFADFLTLASYDLLD